jgi:hypothetical protein
MISSQLGRSLLESQPVAADLQDARPDTTGSYGELMADIDRILGDDEGRERAHEAAPEP